MHYKREPTPRDLLKAATDNWLTAHEDMAMNVIARDGGTGAMGTREGFLELFGGVVGETEGGVGLAVEVFVVVGRKAGVGGWGWGDRS